MEGKLTRYFKLKRIEKYLESKNESQYNFFDKILICYINGELEKTLEDYGFKNVNIYSKIGRKGNDLQIECCFHDLMVNIGFDDKNFDYIVYSPNISIQEFANSIIQNEYDHDFSVEKFIENLHDVIKKDRRIKEKL